MLNCVNNLNLEPQSMNSGIERAALMVSEEKQESRKNFISSKSLCNPFFSLSSIFWFLILLLKDFFLSFEYFFVLCESKWRWTFFLFKIIAKWCHNFFFFCSQNHFQIYIFFPSYFTTTFPLSASTISLYSLLFNSPSFI